MQKCLICAICAPILTQAVDINVAKMYEQDGNISAAREIYEQLCDLNGLNLGVLDKNISQNSGTTAANASNLDGKISESSGQNLGAEISPATGAKTPDIRACYALGKLHENSGDAKAAQAYKDAYCAQAACDDDKNAILSEPERIFAQAAALASGGKMGEAAQIWEQNCADGEPKSCLELSKFYAKSDTIKSQNFLDDAILNFQNSCDYGDFEACLSLAAIDSENSVEILSRACDENFAPACHVLGLSESTDAAKFAQKSCELGYLPDCK